MLSPCNKYELETYSKYKGRDSVSNLRRRLSSITNHSEEFHKVINEIELGTFNLKSIETDGLAERLGYINHKFKEQINNDFKIFLIHPSREFDDFKKTLEKNIDTTEILYFPTYRRVEEDLKNLEIAIENDEFDFEVSGSSEIPIQFGMNDVEKRFEEIKVEIGRLSGKGLNALSGEILRQLVRGTVTAKKDISNISKEDVEVVISRLGNMFDGEDQKRIISLVESGKYPKTDNLLVYFLSKLVEVYEEQKEIDAYTDKFTNVCNSYLQQTKIIFDKATVDLYAYSEKTKGKISLNNLSSGEQQIVSLFSKIYLNSNRSFIVLFDEPELSLSIFWQMKLLPDIIESQKCKLLVAVTHSPFIYDNNLTEKTRNLADFINENNAVESNER